MTRPVVPAPSPERAPPGPTEQGSGAHFPPDERVGGAKILPRVDNSRRRIRHARTMDVRVLIVDDHAVVAESLASRLRVEEGVLEVATETNPDAALSTVERLRPDVVVWDVQLGDQDGLTLLRRAHEQLPRSRAVVVTAHDEPRLAVAAIRAGAVGFVTKGASAAEFVQAVVGAARGESHIDPRMLFRMMPFMQRPFEPTRADERLRRLSTRELEVLEHMLAGESRSTIASELFVSVNTVRTHAKNILSKLDVHSTLEAVRIAFEAGLEPAQSSANGHAVERGDATVRTTEN